MITAAYAQLLARYNQWANTVLYDHVAAMPEDAYRLDRGAFFGSIHATLNHILVADRIWLKRFTGEGEHPDRLDAELFADLASLRAARDLEDDRIIAAMGRLQDQDLAGTLEYRNMAGEAQAKPLAFTIGHFFNHQTHHRGHCHCMASQAGYKPPQLDLLYYPGV